MIEQISKILGFNEKSSNEAVKQISTQQIVTNPFQPRTVFDDEKIEELAKSIDKQGLIQPIIVRPSGEMFEIVAGERRWRACNKLGMQTIPAIIRDLSDEQTATIALIENLQREGLSAIEEANAYQQLLLLQSITQEALAEQLGKSQSAIANKLRLLQLSDEVKEAIFLRQITERHARSLLKLHDVSAEHKFLQEIIQKDLSVKQLDTKIKYYLEAANITKGRRVSFTKDVRLALNTVRQAVEMIKNSGIHVVAEETDNEHAIIIKLEIFKQK